MRPLGICLTLSVAIVLVGSPAGAGGHSRAELATPTAISTLSAKIVDELPTIQRDFRLLVQQPQAFDGVVVDTGRKYAAASQPHVTPSGWTCSPAGGSLRCNGPAIPGGQRTYFSWSSASNVQIPTKLSLELSYQGHPFLKDKIEATYQHGYEVKSDLKDVLDLPGGVTPGSIFMASPKSDDYRDGRWSFHYGNTTIPAVDPATLNWQPHFRGGFPSERLFYQLPRQTGPSLDYSFTYDDPWGDRIVDATPPNWFYGAPTPCSPAGLQACQERVAEGSSVCVCGCFPNLLDVDLTLDGKPIPFPTAMSSSLIRLPLDGVKPGTHVIAWGSHNQSISFEVVSLTGAIAQDKLNLGESTELSFQLNGSKSALPLEISLESKVISIQGGNKQVAYFNGLDPNSIHRTVLATAVGKFSIGYTLQLPPCPCGGWDGTQIENPAFASHPLQAKGFADTTLSGGDLGLHFDLSTNSLVARSPRPPFDPSQTLKLGFAQLGLHAKTANYGELLFEQRSDMPSTASLSNLRLGAKGRLAGAEGMLDLHTEFSMPYRTDLPLKVGVEYTFDVHDFELGGNAPGLGKIQFRQSPDRSSSIQFSDLKTDAAGSTLYGDADFKLYGELNLKF